MLPALEDRHVVAAEAAQVGERRGMEVEAADAPERHERLPDQLPEQERDHHVDIRGRVRVQIGVVDQQQAVPLGHEVDALLGVRPAVRIGGHHRHDLAALRH